MTEKAFRPDQISARQLNEFKRVINGHLGVSCDCPKVKVIYSPKKFFERFTGLKRDRKVPRLIQLNHEVEYFYDHLTGEVVFKGFIRDGAEKFRRIEPQLHPVSDYVHEMIHNVQFRSGGYGKHDFFDEATCEIVAYVLTGDIDKYGPYFEWTYHLWHLLDTQETDPVKKYEMIKGYCVSESKEKMHDDWLDFFVDENSRIVTGRKKLLALLHEFPSDDAKLAGVLAWRETAAYVDELYRVRDKSKITF